MNAGLQPELRLVCIAAGDDATWRDLVGGAIRLCVRVDRGHDVDVTVYADDAIVRRADTCTSVNEAVDERYDDVIVRRADAYTSVNEAVGERYDDVIVRRADACMSVDDAKVIVDERYARDASRPQISRKSLTVHDENQSAKYLHARCVLIVADTTMPTMIAKYNSQGLGSPALSARDLSVWWQTAPPADRLKMFVNRGRTLSPDMLRDVPSPFVGV